MSRGRIAVVHAGQRRPGQRKNVDATLRLQAALRTVRACGRPYQRHSKDWQSQGYRVSVIFLSLQSADSGRRNFHYLYRRLVDDWAHYDNSGSHPVLLEWGANS